MISVFQFHVGTIERIKEIKVGDYFIGFNSTLVRLRVVRKRSLSLPLPSFNSTLVRLRGETEQKHRG